MPPALSRSRARRYVLDANALIGFFEDRAVAAGKNALELTARDCMSAPVVTVPLEASLNECCEAMEKNRVRRVLVIDRTGACCGIVSQADIAVRGKESKAGEVVKEVSEPTSSPSAIPS